MTRVCHFCNCSTYSVIGRVKLVIQQCQLLRHSGSLELQEGHGEIRMEYVQAKTVRKADLEADKPAGKASHAALDTLASLQGGQLLRAKLVLRWWYVAKVGEYDRRHMRWHGGQLPPHVLQRVSLDERAQKNGGVCPMINVHRRCIERANCVCALVRVRRLSDLCLWCCGRGILAQRLVNHIPHLYLDGVVAVALGLLGQPRGGRKPALIL